MPAKRRKAKVSPEFTKRKMVEQFAYFNIPPEHEGLYLQCLKEYFLNQKRVTSEKQAEEKAYILYNDLRQGLSANGRGKWDLGIVKKFDDRIRLVTKGRWQGTAETAKNELVYDLGRGKKTSLTEVDALKLLTDSEQRDFEKEFASLIKQYPDLDRGDIKKDVELYCRINVKLRRVSLSDGDESALKKLMDAKIALGTFLGLSEKMRMNEIIKTQSDNVASLSVLFEKTLQEYPDIMKLMQLKELKMLYQKYERGELELWMLEHTTHAGMSLKEIQKILSKHEEKIYAEE